MGASRLRLLRLLKLEGPRTASELAALLGITPAGVRQHLQSLEEGGLVVPTEERMPIGRPARRWHLGAAARSLFPDRHARLAAGLLEAVRDTFGGEGLERVVARLGERQSEEYRARMPGPEATAHQRFEALAELRAEDGYMAEGHAASEDRWLLVENNCPICAAAETAPDLCEAERSLLEGMLGQEVRVRRTEHCLSDSRRCVYEVVRSHTGSCDAQELEVSSEGRLAH
jgi:predicted ArsR family transcriptional regulator